MVDEISNSRKDKEELPGTPLKGRDIREGKVLTVEEQINAQYMWSTGVAMSRFLNELKKGKIIGRQCPKCGKIYVPPRMFCSNNQVGVR